MKKFIVAAAIATLSLVAIEANPAQTANFTLKKIAEATGSNNLFSDVGDDSINNSGTVLARELKLAHSQTKQSFNRELTAKQVGQASARTSVIATGLGQPVAVAKYGEDFIVADAHVARGGNRLLRVTPNGQVSLIARGFGIIKDVAVSGRDIIVTTYNPGRLLRITPNGKIETIAQLDYFVGGVAVSGDKFIVVHTNGRLLQVTSTGQISTLATRLGSPLDVVVREGNFIVTGGWQSSIKKVTPDGRSTEIVEGLRLVGIPSSITNYGSDFAIVTKLRGEDALLRVTPQGQVSLIASSPVRDFRGITSSGNDLIVTDVTDGQLLRISPIK